MNNWDNNRTNMSEVLCPAGLSYIFAKNAISILGNMASNGIMTRKMKGSKIFAESNLLVISSSLCEF